MMEKRSMLETAAIIAAIFMAAWSVRGEIAENTAATKANTEAIAANAKAIAANAAAIKELRDDVRELRGLLITHIAGHSHAGDNVVAKADGGAAETD